VGHAVIGVDLGGTNLRTALISPAGHILAKQKEASLASEGHQKVISRLLKNITEQREKAGREGLEVVAVGVGAPGVILSGEGIVVTSPNFPDWNNLPLRRELETALSLPVFIENDANTAALGEQWRGAAKDVESMVFLTLGTGVGGGIVYEGRIWGGAHGMAGEVGHMTLVLDGRKCGCGNSGCLEMYASSRGIVMSYLDAVPSGTVDGAGGITSADIYRSASDGDPLAVRVMQEMGRFLGIGIANLINILNPAMVVIGGGVKEAWPLFIEATRREVQRRAFSYTAERTQIVPSLLGDDAGMVGAAAVALQKLR